MKFLSNFVALFKNAWRDKISVFFNIFLPLAILVIFGFVFSNPQGIVKVGILDGASIPSVQKVKFKSFKDIPTLKNAVIDEKIDFAVTLDGTSLHVYLNPSQSDSNEYYISIAKNIANALNVKYGTLPIVSVKRKEVSLSSRVLSYIDTLIPGILALSIFSAGLFSMTSSLAHLRDKKVMKKMWTTPIHKWHFYGAFIVEKVVETYISIVVLFALAMIIFEPHYAIKPFEFSIFVLASTFGMMGLGMIVLLFSPNSKTASEISSVFYTIAMFFSGVYFPISIMPKSMQHIAYSLPLVYMVQCMEYTFGLRKMSMFEFYGILALMLLGFLVVLLGFGKVFKTE